MPAELIERVLDLELHEIDFSPANQVRATPDPDAIERYAARYRDGADMAAIVVFFDGESYWCTDGASVARDLFFRSEEHQGVGSEGVASRCSAVRARDQRGARRSTGR